MRIVELDAGSWTTPLDFLEAVRAAIGAPERQGHDVDAVVDAMVRGLNSLEPPYAIRIEGTATAPSDVKLTIAALARAVKDARLWRANHRYGDVEVTIEIAS